MPLFSPKDKTNHLKPNFSEANPSGLSFSPNLPVKSRKSLIITATLIFLILATSCFSYLAYRGLIFPQTLPLADKPNQISFETNHPTPTFSLAQSQSQVLGEEQAKAEAKDTNTSSFDPASPLNFIQFQTITQGQNIIKSVKYRSGDIVIKNNGLLRVRKESIDAAKIELRSIEGDNIKSDTINSRTIADNSIKGADIDPTTTLTVNSLNLTGQLITQGAVTSSGTQTFESEATFENGITITSGDADIQGNLTADGYLTLGDSAPDHFSLTPGDLFASGHLEVNQDSYFDQNLTIGNDLHVGGVIYGSISGAYSPSGDLDMASNIIYNIGNAGTDFNTLGGLTLANQLSINSGGAIIQGNVGIGTTNPSQKLDVNGAIALNGKLLHISTPNKYLDLDNTGAANVVLQGYGNFYFNNYDGSSYGARMTILGGGVAGSGNVGIGTTNPGYILDVAGTARVSANIIMPNWTDVRWGWDTDGGTIARLVGVGGAGGYLGAYTNGTEKMRITSTGNVGIGTTNPGAPLEIITSPVSGEAVSIKLNNTSFAWNSGPSIQNFFNVNGTQRNLTKIVSNLVNVSGGNGSADLRFFTTNLGTSSSEAMRINYNGNVGIGTTNPGARLEVAGTAGNGSIKLDPSSSFGSYIRTTAGTNYGFLYLAPASNRVIISDSAQAYIFSIYNATTEAVSLNSNGNSFLNGGNVGIGTTSPSALLSVAGDSTKNAYFFYDNANVGDTTDGQSLYVYRRAAEGDAYLRMYVDSWNGAKFDSAGGIKLNTSLTETWGSFNIGASWAPSGNNFTFQQFGYITAASASKYIQWQVNDVTDNFELTRQDSNIGYFNVNMPTIFTGGNVGIGTTNPGNTLSVSGSASISDYLYLNSGIRTNQSNFPLISYWNGSAYQNVISLSSGNVGIGTTAPGVSYSSKLEVFQGNIVVNDFSNNPYGIVFRRNDLTKGAIDTSFSALTIQAYNNSDIKLIDDSLNGMIVKDGGNVGIGTTAPTSKLQIAEYDGFDHDTLRINDTHFGQSVGLGMGANGSWGIKLFLNGIAQTVFENGGMLLGLDYLGFNAPTNGAIIEGNVGIGTTNPGAKLQVSNPSGSNLLRLSRVNSTRFNVDEYGDVAIRSEGDSYAASLGVNTLADNSKGIVIRGYSATQASNLQEWQDYNGNTLTAISAVGNIGIGTTNPSEKLQVAGGNILLNNVQAIGWGSDIVSGSRILGSSNQLIFRTNAVDRLTINSSGNVGIGTTAPSFKFSVAGASTDNAYFFYDNANVGDTTDGQGLYVYRRAAEGNSYLKLFNDQWGQSQITSSSNLVIYPGTGAYNILNYNTWIGANYGATGENYNLRQFGYITAATSSKYIQWQVNDTTDNFELTRQDSNIGYFDVKMPTIFTGGNVGIGTTNPGNPLDVAVSGTYASVARFYSSTGGGVVIGGESGAGTIYSTSGKNLSFGTSYNPDQVFITTSGNVGVGMTNPWTKFTVLDAISSRAFTAVASVQGAYFGWNKNNGDGSTWLINNDASVGGNAFHFVNTSNGTTLNDLMTITTTGNVGIGTTNPSQLLSLGSGAVLHTQTASHYTELFNNDSDTGWYWDDADDSLQYRNNNEQRIFLDQYNFYVQRNGSNYFQVMTDRILLNSGNVGIGTTNPGAKLSVSGGMAIGSAYATSAVSDGNLLVGSAIGIGTTAFTGYSIDIRGGNPTLHFQPSVDETAIYSYYQNGGGMFVGVERSTGGALLTDASPYAGVVGTTTGYPLQFGVNRLVKMTLNTSGNVGIGTTSPGQKLSVNGVIEALRTDYPSENIQLYSNYIDSSNYGGNISWKRDASGSTYNPLRFFAANNSGSVERLRIDGSGNVGIGTTNPTSNLYVYSNTAQDAMIVRANGGGTWTIDQYGALSSSAGSLIAYDNNVSTGAFTSWGNTYITSGASIGSAYNIILKPSGTGNIQMKGNVGIGTTNPSTSLEIGAGTLHGISVGAAYPSWMGDNGLYLTGNAYMGGALTVGNGYSLAYGTGLTYIMGNSVGGNYALHYVVHSTETMTMLDGGNVGIGTTNPGAQLEISGSNSSELVALRLSNTNSASNELLTLAFYSGGTPVNTASIKSKLYSGGASGDLAFFTRSGAGGTTQKMVIDNIGNVGIGTTAPTAMLSVAGGLRVGSTYAGIGSTAASNNSWFEGSVGIGTTSPSTLLDIESSALAKLRLSRTGTYAGAWNFDITGFNGGEDGTLRLTPSVSTGDFNVTSSGYISRFFIDTSSGNVGIGTTNPTYTLDVNGNINASTYNISGAQALYTSGGGNTTLRSTTAKYLSFLSNDTENMRLDANGRLGIGTTNPTNLLDVAGGAKIGLASFFGSSTAPSNGILIQGNVGIGKTGVASGFALDVNGNILIANEYALSFGTLGSPANIMKMDTGSRFLIRNPSSQEFIGILASPGRMGIGTTAPAAMLSVAGGLRAGSTYAGIGSTAASNNSWFEGNVGIGTTNPQRALHVNGNIRMGALITGAGGAVAVYRDTNGDLADSTSSLKYKTNITDMKDVLPKLLSLQAVRFEWNNQTSTPGMEDFGMIAEEVNNVLPDLVTYNPDGTPRGLKYEKMGLFALKGLQEQQSIISHQSSIISQLGNIANLSQDDLEKLNLNSTSIDNKLTIIADALTKLSNDQAQSSDQLNQLTTNYQLLTTNYQILDTNYQLLTKNYQLLEDQMALIKDQNQTLMDFYTAFEIGNVLMKDAEGNLNLANGQLEAEGIVAGAFTVKVVDEEAATIGETVIKPVEVDENNDGLDDKTGSDGKSITIETKAVKNNSRIFLTPVGKNPINWIVNNIEEKKGFTILLSEPTKNEIKFNWWIAQEQ
jgi:hypothetical protein